MTPRERLFALERFGIKLGLEQIVAILDALGRPDRAWPAVHVAGTNGKGSVTAMVERSLRVAGHRTGRYTSPHLDRIEERVAIGGTPVDSQTFDTVTAEVLDLIDTLRAAGTLTVWPTFFETTTAIAFEIFRRHGVSVAVIEVGLGGRFDATNVIAPMVSVITSIALDHERHLGSTLEQIAFEKAGIIKAGVPVVVGDLPSAAAAVIGREAAARGAPIVAAATLVSAHMTRGRATIVAETPERRYPPTALGLAGAHQAGNALLAIRALELCAERGVTVRPEDVVCGLSDVHWPARLEWLKLDSGRHLLIDAAHNPAGAEALAAYLQGSGVAPLPMVLAIMRDKNAAGMIAPLTRVASRFVATQVPSERSLAAADLARVIAGHAPGMHVDIEGEATKAVARALSDRSHAVVGGSIFLVGPLRAQLVSAGAITVREPS